MKYKVMVTTVSVGDEVEVSPDATILYTDVADVLTVYYLEPIEPSA